MRKYYGVAGTRGYGVYNNWYQARNARRYTPHYKVKGEKDLRKRKHLQKINLMNCRMDGKTDFI